MAAPNTHIDELLNLYLDRELTRDQEEQLYSRLAEDEQLRSRLKQMQMLRSETRNYLAGLTPSAAVTGSVFTGLGFSSRSASAAGQAAKETAETAAAGTAAVSGSSFTTSSGAVSTAASTGSTATTATSGILGTVKTLWIPISAAIITAAVTTIVVFSVIDDSQEITSDPAPDKIQTQTTETTQQPVEPQPAVPPARQEEAGSVSQSSAALPSIDASPSTGTSESSANASAAGQPVETQVQEDIPQQTTNSASEEADPIVSATEESAPAEIASAKTVPEEQIETAPATTQSQPAAPAADPVTEKPVLPMETRSLVPYAPLAPVYRTPVVLVPGETKETDIGDRMVLYLEGPPERGFALKLRGYAARSFPGVAMGTRPKYDLERMFENASVGFYYKISSNDMIGVEIGQDAFTQKYSGFIRGMERSVEQNLLAPWATFQYRYAFNGMFGQVLLRPYMGAGIGLTQQAWTLGRGSAGLILAPSDSFEMMFGLEGMMLAYPFDGQWFNTQKLGFSYALVLNF